MISNAFILMPPGNKPEELTLSSENREQINQLIEAGKGLQPEAASTDDAKKPKLARAAFFYGAAGSGKSHAAAAIGKALDSPVYRVDLDVIISKYISNTEKNLDRLFKKAVEKKAVLFFDEADALFGKRTEVRNAHDRYTNQELSYLLQKIEEHEVIVILAAKTKDNIDKAFLRRLRFVVEF